MSTSAQPSPVSNSQPSDQPNLDGPSSTVELPPDPLLDSGSFIDATTTNDQTLNGTENVGDQQPPETPAANGADPVQAPESTPQRQNTAPTANDTPSWLPPGFIVERKERTSGATAGTVDKYYVHIASGRKCRSKNEVFNFLKTGSKTRKRKMDNSDTSKEGSSTTNNTLKKQRAKEKTSVPYFDFNATPEKITWVLVDQPENKWTAFIDGKEVPAKVRQEWAAVFEALCTADSDDDSEF